MPIPPLQPPELPPSPKAATAASPAPPAGPACMDCGTVLQDKFCHTCGQRKQRRTASIFSLLGDFISDLFNWDSRFWRTMWPLFAKPGHLTKAFMDGKRQRYIPPVRLYLVSSIIFFLLISMSPRSMLNQVSDVVNFKAGGVGTGLEQGLDTRINRDSAMAVVAALKEAELIPADAAPEITIEDQSNIEPANSVDLDARVVMSVDAPANDSAVNSQSDSAPANDIKPAEQNGPTDAMPNSPTSSAPESVELPSSDDESTIDIEEFDLAVTCKKFKVAGNSTFSRMLERQFHSFCDTVTTWRGLFEFFSELIDNLPKTLLALLPLMAFVNKLLYLFARRFYVEHLLYYVHNYSFLFLFSVFIAGIVKLLDTIGLGGSGFLITLSYFYVVYYFFRSMRVVYAQGWWITLVKWFVLMIVFAFIISVVISFFTLATAALHAL